MNAKRLVDVKELSSILNVPVSWIYDRTRQGQEAIPHIKLDMYVRFDPEDVIAHFRKETTSRRH